MQPSYTLKGLLTEFHMKLFSELIAQRVHEEYTEFIYDLSRVSKSFIKVKKTLGLMSM